MIDNNSEYMELLFKKDKDFHFICYDFEIAALLGKIFRQNQHIYLSYVLKFEKSNNIKNKRNEIQD